MSALVRGRLAPSPTGLLHLGNAWSFLWAWTAARAEKGRVALRIEDIDPARSRREWEEAAVLDLRWLGLDWDEGPVRQSERCDIYESACARLRDAGRMYPCYCTRRELRELAGAPHGPARGIGNGIGDAGAAYPGTCRRLTPKERAAREAEGRRPAWRLACPPPGPDGQEPGVIFKDMVAGPQCMTFARCGGDFALRRSDGGWAYQLAVAVDDMDMGVTHIVRGEDILYSTRRQILLYELLSGMFNDRRPMTFAHLPLLHDEAGERLAKRHGSMGLAALRNAGVSAGAVTGFLAAKAGLAEKGELLSPPALLDRVRRGGGVGVLWRALQDAGKRGPVRVLPEEMSALQHAKNG